MKRVVGILAAVLLTTFMFGQATMEMDDQAETGNSNNASVSVNYLSNGPNPSESTHYVGEYYGGGIVFHIDDDGQHGLICAVVDASTRKQRHNRAVADTIDYRGGVAAGNILIESINTLEDAQAESFGDWYLATRYDLNKLYLNRHVIGGYSDFSKGWKKIGVSSLNTWFQSFVTGARFTNGKDDAVYVRVIREF